MSLSMESDQGSYSSSFYDWMGLQECDLSELLQFLDLNISDGKDDLGAELSKLVEKNQAFSTI